MEQEPKIPTLLNRISDVEVDVVAADRDLSASKEWIVDYLSEKNEDIFRKKYFSKLPIKIVEENTTASGRNTANDKEIESNMEDVPKKSKSMEEIDESNGD